MAAVLPGMEPESEFAAAWNHCARSLVLRARPRMKHENFTIVSAEIEVTDSGILAVRIHCRSTWRHYFSVDIAFSPTGLLRYFHEDVRTHLPTVVGWT